MEIIIALIVLGLALAVFLLRRLSIFVERNEQRAYTMAVLHAVEARASFDSVNDYR